MARPWLRRIIDPGAAAEVDRIAVVRAAQGVPQLFGYDVAMLYQAARLTGQTAAMSAIAARLNDYGSSWESGAGAAALVRGDTRNMLSRAVLVRAGLGRSGWVEFLAVSQRFGEGKIYGFESDGSFRPVGGIQSSSACAAAIGESGSFRTAAVRGALYLIDAQNADGSWYSYPLFGINEVYPSENAAALEALGALSDQLALAAGWTLDDQGPRLSSAGRSCVTDSAGPFDLSCRAVDEGSGVDSAWVVLAIGEQVTRTALLPQTGDSFRALLGIQPIGTIVHYHFEARDCLGNLSRYPESREIILCVGDPARGDLDGDGRFSISDLLAFMQAWRSGALAGSNPRADLDNNGVVNVWDLVFLMIRLAGSGQSALTGAAELPDLSAGLAARVASQEYPQSFGVIFGNEASEAVAAELVFRSADGLELGGVVLTGAGSALGLVTSGAEGGRLRVMVFDRGGGGLPSGSAVFRVLCRSADGRRLAGEAVVLESCTLLDRTGVAIGARVSLEGLAELPRTFALEQNSPNPFNPSTTIGFALPGDSPVWVSLRVYNLKGQLVRTLIDAVREPGGYQVQWDGADNRGVAVPSGIYFYRMRAGEFFATRKLVVLK